MTSLIQALTEEFMRKANQVVRDAPQKPTDPELCRIIALIHEEFLETARAAGVQITLQTGNELALEHPNNQFGYAVTGEFDIIEFADGMADTMFTVTCGLSAAGIEDTPLMMEICQSNLTRFGPGGHWRKDGKYIKSPEWTPPNIARVLYGPEENSQ